MIKAPKKLGIEGLCLNVVKAIYDNPVARHHPEWGETEKVVSKIRNDTRMSSLKNFIQYFRAIRQEKERKRMQIEANDTILYLEDLKDSTKRLRPFTEVSGC
jgi:hypothetical protein